MTRDGWRALVLEAVRLNDHGDPTSLDLLATLLTQQDQAKQEPRLGKLWTMTGTRRPFLDPASARCRECGESFQVKAKVRNG